MSNAKHALLHSLLQDHNSPCTFHLYRRSCTPRILPEYKAHVLCRSPHRLTCRNLPCRNLPIRKVCKGVLCGGRRRCTSSSRLRWRACRRPMFWWFRLATAEWAYWGEMHAKSRYRGAICWMLFFKGHALVTSLQLVFKLLSTARYRAPMEQLHRRRRWAARDSEG